jgi:RNA polymerase sigma-70 factor, ECF subfamily
MDPSTTDVTALLAQLTRGDREAVSNLLPVVYKELRQVAGRYMRQERPDHTLQATALVHEAYIKLVSHGTGNWENRAHFFAVAAQVMRHILVDHARSHQRDKRGNGQPHVELQEGLVVAPAQLTDLVEIDTALQRLAEVDSRQAKIVELRFFGGLTVEETAVVLDISPKTVKRDWSVAKAWLHGELKQSHGNVVGEVGGN